MRHYLDSIGLWVCVWGIDLIILTDMEEPSLKGIGTLASFGP